MEYLSYVLIAILIVLSVLMCFQESQKKVLSFPLALLLCLIITPFAVYILFLFLPEKNPKGCIHCGNGRNESAFCGLCGKNELGAFHPYWKVKNN